VLRRTHNVSSPRNIFNNRIQVKPFDAQPEETALAFGEIDIPYWSESHHVLKICKVTGLRFWTRDNDRETCGDTSEDPYTFIGNPIIKGFNSTGKKLKDQMREVFLKFFDSRGHTRVEPYPVIARWRDDIHLTIASIADFQPHVTSGLVPPPANPLGISQPCIRLTDVAAVGRSGRHLSTFEMMAHHAFNRPLEGDVIYWIDQCVRYCDELLVESLGIDPMAITYVENPWSGGGNAGPALEVIVGGLELATLVFMNLEEKEDGDISIKGQKYSEMNLQIIDTGYGLERFCWAASGTPTIYEAIYPESIEWLKSISGFHEFLESLELKVEVEELLGELSRLAGILNIDVGTDVEGLYLKLSERLQERGIQVSLGDLKRVTEPLSSIYAIPDHMHAICNMLGDGLVPSNTKAGYLARMLVRRVCRMKDSLSMQVSLSELGTHHMTTHMDMERFVQSKEGIIEILELEEERYHQMLRKGIAAVKTALKELPKESDQVGDEILFRLSEERGLNPEMVISIANELGWNNLSVRVGFTADMAARNAMMTKVASKERIGSEIFATGGHEKTKLDFYKDTEATEFSAHIIDCFPLSDLMLSKIKFSAEVTSSPSYAIVTDKTLFYPEGGGQLGDQGVLIQGDDVSNVLDTKSQDGVVFHLTDSPLEVAPVTGRLNQSRRKQLMDHHTAVHIVGGAARKVLGPHVWQAGSNKGERYARLDITHHSRLSGKEIEIIEDTANQIIESNFAITKEALDRAEADRKYGFDIYQGGPPKHEVIRVISIGDFDIQACGGTHHDQTSKIGELRITRSSQVQDGVERLQIVAGETSRQNSRRQERILSEASDILGVQSEDLPKAVSRFFEEWKSQQKKIESLEAEIVRLRTDGGGEESTELDGVRYVVMEVEGDMKQMMTMLSQLTRDTEKPTLAILGTKSGGGKIIVASTEGTIASERHNAVEILNAISGHINGGGGGRPTMAQGGGTKGDGIPNALEEAKSLLGL